MVSYWSKNGQQAVSASSVTAGLTKNGWTLYKHKVVNPANGTITISGNGTIDELKLYPEEGKMTAYTYDPLIGISSKDDMNEEISYYKYDGLHRLICIYDMDKKVIKKFCYNYAGQPENCSSDIVYYNQQMSQAFVRNNCQPGYTGTEVIYTIPAETYSSLISQADADSKAQNDINTTGQFYANTNGNCLIMYYNQPLSKFFFKNDCQAGYSGTKVLYEVPASKYNSVISQADANAKAQADMDANGQAYANTNGNCVLGCLKCIGEANKCINAICETGAKVVTDTYGSGKDWWCVYHYEWSDGTYSQDYIEKGFLPCPITQ